MLGALGRGKVGGNGQQAGQRSFGVPHCGEVHHGRKRGSIFPAAEDFKAADPAYREAGDILHVVLQLGRNTVQIDGRRAIQAGNQQLPYALQFAFGEEVVGAELAQDLVTR